MNELDPRRQTLWELQDFARGRGLEIGPLHDPIVSKTQADVHYIDIQDQAGLRAYYQDHPGIPVDAIPEIDYPLTQPDGRIVSLVEASRSGAPFDWVVASHVVEHVPDVVGWLGELAEVVADGGALVLVVPDRRYCFDVHRPPTTVGQMLEAHLLGAVRPGVRAVYDHYSRAVQYEVSDLWAGAIPPYERRFHTLTEARTKVEQGLTDYVDCHVWLFSPDSLLEQLHELRLIDRSQWYVDRLRPTQDNSIEFMVRLRRLPRGADPSADVEGELLPQQDRPDWLAHPADRRRTEALERRAGKLEERLARRAGRTQRLRRRIARQEALIGELRTELARLRPDPGTATAEPGRARQVAQRLRRRRPD